MRKMIYQGNMRAEGIIFFKGWMNHHKVAPLNTLVQVAGSYPCN